ncbi:MAG: hypothetical protein ED559_06120 [Phycisphaera sp.]|nr:MAG: hypothetical protein ED559_06120 [Phycisphaera sp.]
MLRRFLHEEVLIGGYERQAGSLGWRCTREYRLLGGYIDLVAESMGVVLAVEAELTPARIPADIGKAAQLAADRLVILVPNARVRGACERRLGRLTEDGTRLPVGVDVCTLPKAIQQLRSYRW